MDSDTTRQEQAEDDELPQALIDELRRRDSGVPLLTARVDRAVAERATAHFAGRKSRYRIGPVPLAAAASLLVAAIVLSPFVFRHDAAPELTDVDGSGSVDIADVFAIARNGSASPAELDAWARQVVSLANWEDAT